MALARARPAGARVRTPPLASLLGPSPSAAKGYGSLPAASRRSLASTPARSSTVSRGPPWLSTRTGGAGERSSRAVRRS
eukprot:1685598-Alexandrium_andersonii.AAC.1